MASDIHQWVVLVGEEPPPPKIPWALIGATIFVIGAVGYYAWRKK